eukprot:3899256-Rhodomonas_salina.4
MGDVWRGADGAAARRAVAAGGRALGLLYDRRLHRHHPHWHDQHHHRPACSRVRRRPGLLNVSNPALELSTLNSKPSTVKQLRRDVALESPPGSVSDLNEVGPAQVRGPVGGQGSTREDESRVRVAGDREPPLPLPPPQTLRAAGLRQSPGLSVTSALARSVPTC